jgi:putative peptidoglycan lipid II flippase
MGTTSLRSQNTAIVKGIVWVMAFVVLAKLAGLAKEVAIAYRYGTGEVVDAYLFAFSLANWPIAVWFSVLTVVYVPLAAKLQNQSRESLEMFQRQLLGVTLLIGSLLAAVLWFGVPWALKHSFLQFEGLERSLVQELISSLALLIPLGLLTSLFSAWVLAEGRQWNTLLEGIPALTILIFVVALPFAPVHALVWGTLLGASLHMAGLVLCHTYSSGLLLPTFRFNSPEWATFGTGVGVLAVGQVFISFTGIIDQLFAADLHPGAIATLGYANRILALLLTLGGTVIARALLPVFAVAHASNTPRLGDLVVRWALIVFIAALVSACLGWPFASWGVQLLFERGAFTPTDTEAVATAVQYGLIQIPFYLCGIVLVQFLASRGDYFLLLMSGILGLISKLAGNYLLAEKLGVPGILLANSVMYGVNLILFSVFLFRSRLV